MKTKICIIITAIIFFTASELTAVEDKIFTSSGQIVEGEFWGNVYIYNDETIVDMLGGHLDSIGTYDASTVNVTGGQVNTLEAHEFSTANLSGGYVHGPRASDHASVNFSGNASAVSLRAEDFGTVNMTGGSVDHISTYHTGTSNLYGGTIEYIFARNSSIVNIYGYELVKTNSGGRYGYGQVYGFWPDDSPFTIDLKGSETYSHINLIPVFDVEIEIRPETINLANKGKWITCHIWLPEEYNVADIEPNSVVLEAEPNDIYPDWIWFNEKQNVVMARFPRSEIAEILEPGDVELTVTGKLADGTVFTGTDTIKVIDKGRSHKGRVNSNSIVEDGIEYYIQTDKSVYCLGENVQMLYRITNLGDEDVTFGYFALPVWNFWVEKGREIIWQAVNIWYGVRIKFTLNPGESKEFPAHDHPRIWNMRDSKGNLVSVGRYSVIGGLYNGSGNYDYTKVAVPIRIVPESAHASPKNK